MPKKGVVQVYVDDAIDGPKDTNEQRTAYHLCPRQYRIVVMVVVLHMNESSKSARIRDGREQATLPVEHPLKQRQERR